MNSSSQSKTNNNNLGNKQMRQRANGGRSSDDMCGNIESGRGGGRPGGMSSHEANANIMEQRNNDGISELSDQVAP